MLYLLLLCQIAVSIALPITECDLLNLNISGGNFTLNREEEVVEYTCPEGKYPHPVPKRQCQYNKQWTKEKIPSVCKDFQCPRPITIDNGSFQPRKPAYYVGDEVEFECYGGFELKGSEIRTCLNNGKWSGKTAVCENHGGYCPDPGVPIGTSKTGNAYGFGDKVRYECQQGLEMFGSKERECLEEKHWSGSEPMCRYWYTYDTPEEVAEMFSSTLSANIEVADPDKVVQDISKRKIKVKKGDPLNIFIILDASKSVSKKNFNTAKESAAIFIEKVSSFDIEPRYAIISYASKAKDVVRLTSDESVEPEDVIRSLENHPYEYHKDRSGTNTRIALASVHEMLVAQELQVKENFLNIRNVILLMTDGKYNMGGDPRVEVKRIRELLDIGKKDNPREDFLDIYVFGLGDDISQTEINDIASKKPHEDHTFHLQNIDEMKKAFDKIIDDTEAMDMCGINKYHSNKPTETFPWIVSITTQRLSAEEACKGSILTKRFILTAAHCFHFDEPSKNIKVEIGELWNVAKHYRHPKYKPEGKQDKNIRKTFDYDIALLELEKKIEFSATARPICIPCTKSASWALRMKGENTRCIDHEKFLFKEENEQVNALFIAAEDGKPMEQKSVTIKSGNLRKACLTATEKIDDFKDVQDIRDVVTDQFLCTGGTEPNVEPPTCKGDSGGPLIIQYRKRYIQVGVISWGTVIHCKGSTRKKEPVPENSRDYHVSVIPMIDWIEQTVKEELLYLPQ
ncbi:complement factor B-like [Pelodytes ibericus]